MLAVLAVAVAKLRDQITLLEIDTDYEAIRSINARAQIEIDLGNLNFPRLETRDEWVLHGFSYANYLAELGADALNAIFGNRCAWWRARAFDRPSCAHTNSKSN